MQFTTAYADAANAQFAAMRITRPKEVDAWARKIIAQKHIFMRISARTGIPWPWLGAVLYRESGLRMDCHFHNGDPLTGKTRNVPAGRLPGKSPPYDFEESAWDALCVMKGLHKIELWSLARQTYEAERYNGFGYANKGRPSPYLWAGSDRYRAGKYVRDGVYDPHHIDRQLGVMPLIQRVAQLDGAALTKPAAASDLVAEVAKADDKAIASTKGMAASGSGVIAPASLEGARQTAGTAAGFDGTSLGLLLACLALVGFAVWFAYRAGWYRRVAAALEGAVLSVAAWRNDRAALPAPNPSDGQWTQVAT